MKLTSLKIKRYRSFFDEVIIPMTDFTVVTGANNLGKSTVLSALEILFSALPSLSMGSIFENRPWQLSRYSFERDYPQHKVGRRGRRSYTTVSIEVAFSAQDIENAEEILDIRVPSTIWIVAEFGNPRYKTTAHIECSPDLGESTTNFLIWFRDNFRFLLIPANRNFKDLQSYLFSELVTASFRSVRRSERRLQAIQRFYEDVKKEMDEISATLVEELRPYLPDTRAIELITKQVDPSDLIGISDVVLDDGAKTSLHQKGDGVRSLFAISILQYLARARYGTNLIFGIEEPEAHLHPNAIYELKASLRELSNSFQVILTTHSPILVQRDRLASNIIIRKQDRPDFACDAFPAANSSQVRAALGIRPQDNMLTAEVVIVTEGVTEQNVLTALLSAYNNEVADALSEGRLKVLPAGGASKVLPVVRALARDATSCIVLLDSDQEGNTAASAIARSGLVHPADVFQVPNRMGCQETEFEDSFEPENYIDEVAAACGIALDINSFRREQARTGGRGNRSKKWGDVMDTILHQRGKSWDSLAEEAKSAFAAAIVEKSADLDISSLPYIESIGVRSKQLLREQ